MSVIIQQTTHVIIPCHVLTGLCVRFFRHYSQVTISCIKNLITGSFGCIELVRYAVSRCLVLSYYILKQ